MDAETKVASWTNLNAEEKVNLWKSLNITNLFDGCNPLFLIHEFQASVKLWLEIIQFLDCPGGDCLCTITSDTLTESVKTFWQTFRRVKDRVPTPYVHALLMHAPRMLTSHGSLRKFSTSAQELTNSVQTMVQFRGTNQQNIPRDITIHRLLSLWFAEDVAIQTPLKCQRMKSSNLPSPKIT